MAPFVNLISTSVAVVYLNESMNGLFFPLAVVVLVAGLVWRLVKPFVALTTRLVSLVRGALQKIGDWWSKLSA